MNTARPAPAAAPLPRGAGLDATLLMLLVGIAGLGPVALNGVLPAASAVMRELRTDYAAAQLVLTVFLVATFSAQIVLGRAADRYGRRPVMIASLALFSLGSAACALAPTIETLLAARFVQGFGGAVCVFLPRTIVRDVYPEDRAASVIGYVTTAMMIAPMFGPAVGGWVTERGDWRWMYVGLSALGALAAVLAWRFLRETRGTLDDSPVPAPGTKAGGAPATGGRGHAGAGTAAGTGRSWSAGETRAPVRTLLAEPAFRAVSLVLAGSVGIYYGFLAGAPYVAMESRAMGAAEYGRWFMVVAVGYLAGNLLAGRFSARFGTHRMMTLGAVPLVLGATGFVAFSGSDAPAALFVPMLFVAVSNGIVLPNASSALMSVRPELAATASGLAGSLQTGAGVLLTIAIGIALGDGDGWLFVAIAACAAAALAGLALRPAEGDRKAPLEEE